MPTVLRRSGNPWQRPDGTWAEPRALIHACEACGAENAPFGEWKDGKIISWCGWDRDEMKPICVKHQMESGR